MAIVSVACQAHLGERVQTLLISGGATSMFMFIVCALWQQTVRDGDALRRTKSELHEAQERCFLAMNGTRDGLWDWDLRTDACFYSPQWLSMLGYEERDMQRHINATFELIHPQDVERIRETFEYFLQNGNDEFEAELRLLHKNGRYLHVLSRGLAVRDPKTGVLIRIVGTHVDLTNQKRRQRELLKFKTTLDVTADCVYMYCPDTLQLEYANRAASLQTGYTVEKLISMRFTQIEDNWDEAAFRRMLAPLRGGHQDSLHYETHHRDRDGEKIPVAVHLQYVAPPDEPAQFVAIVRDVTARKEQEAALRAAKERAEQASQAKSRFLATMSHELRTPLNGVAGMTELLRRTNLDERQRKFVEACQNSGKLLLCLINDILDISKIEAGKLTLEEETVDIQQLVDDSALSLWFQAEEKGLLLIREVSPAVGQCLLGDATRLRQVLVNLIGNAIKFTEAGRVDVRVTASEHPSGQRIRFEVEDTGVGIALQKTEAIFDAFTQEEGASAANRGGSGLGLAISKLLVEMMGGEINVKSMRGAGSTFWFELPYRQPPLQKPLMDSMNRAEAISFQALAANFTKPELSKPGLPTPAGVVRTKKPKKYHILLAEDNPTNQLFGSEVVRRAGMLCDCVSDGSEAVAAVARRSYDLILMDCRMPEVDGFEATHRIRQMEKVDKLRTYTPIVALTANAIKGDREQCLAAGMSEYVSKPYTPNELLEVIAAQLHLITPHSQQKAATKTVRRTDTDSAKQDAITTQDLLIRCSHNARLATELLQEFADDLPNRLEHLSRAMAEQDTTALADEAHSLKGAAGIVAASGLQSLASELDSQCRTAAPAIVDRLASRIGEEANRFLQKVPEIHRELQVSAPRDIWTHNV